MQYRFSCGQPGFSGWQFGRSVLFYLGDLWLPLYYFFVGHLPQLGAGGYTSYGWLPAVTKTHTASCFMLRSGAGQHAALSVPKSQRLSPSQRERHWPPSWPGVRESASRPEPDQSESCTGSDTIKVWLVTKYTKCLSHAQG